MPRFISARANAYRALRQYQVALRDYDRAIELDARSAEAYFYRACTYDDLGLSQKALEDTFPFMILPDFIESVEKVGALLPADDLPALQGRLEILRQLGQQIASP